MNTSVRKLNKLVHYFSEVISPPTQTAIQKWIAVLFPGTFQKEVFLS